MIIVIRERYKRIVLMEGRLQHNPMRPLPFLAEPACHALTARHKHILNKCRVLTQAH